MDRIRIKRGGKDKDKRGGADMDEDDSLEYLDGHEWLDVDVQGWVHSLVGT